MLEKLKKLPFITVRETKNLDHSEILYVDYSKENDGNRADVYTKSIACGSTSIESDEDFIDKIETIFINKIKEYNTFDFERVINIDKKLLEIKDINIISITINKFLEDLNDETNECFAIIPLHMSCAIQEKNNNVLELYSSNKLSNEIIFGKKTRIDMPGMVLITNEEGLKNKSDIRFAVCELGFFPNKVYYTIKIN